LLYYHRQIMHLPCHKLFKLNNWTMSGFWINIVIGKRY